MDEVKCLGAKIRALRKSKKITQEQLSEMIDISPRHMVKIENGQVYPSFPTLKKIAQHLDTTIELLFENDYYDDCESIKEKLHNIVDKSNEKNIRFLYVIASHLD